MTNDINDLDTILPDASSELKGKFITFFDLIARYNGKINLVSPSTISQAAVKHFADSYLGLQIILNIMTTEKNIFDFGSGNGFPGIIMSMMAEDRQLTLVERDRRKSEFLKIAAHHLSLKNVTVAEVSVNDLANDSCPLVISRAMAPISKFLLESRKVVPVGGSVYLFKGSSWTREFGECPPQIFDFWDVSLCGAYNLPIDNDPRVIIECKRVDG